MCGNVLGCFNMASAKWSFTAEQLTTFVCGFFLRDFTSMQFFRYSTLHVNRHQALAIIH